MCNETDYLDAKELYGQYTQFCMECPKAYDFTCSGADSKRCEEKKAEILNKCRNKQNQKL